MTTPSAELHLKTLYELDDRGRMVRTLEPDGTRPPAFVLVRGVTDVGWAVRDDVEPGVADELGRLVAASPSGVSFQFPPRQASRILEVAPGRVTGGPAYSFPEMIPSFGDVVEVGSLDPFARYFGDFTVEEVAARAPVFAVLEEGHAVSACYCARPADDAAEAGLVTAEPYRGRGYGPRVTAAWAAAVRTSGRVPLYSTSWTNHSSRAVARKLGLVMYAASWNIVEAT